MPPRGHGLRLETRAKVGKTTENATITITQANTQRLTTRALRAAGRTGRRRVSGWRAVLNVGGRRCADQRRFKRMFGNPRNTIRMALDDLFCRCGSLIPDTEQRKLRADAEAMRVRRERSLAIGIMPRAPELHLQAHRWLNASKQADGAGAPEADAKHAPVAREASPEGTTHFQPTKVQWVHQI